MAERAQAQRILVVDDDPAIRTLVRVYLERNGYMTWSAASADEAFQLAYRHDRDIGLLLTDVIMPHIGGLELANRLRQTNPEMPVLLMSGSGYPEGANTRFPFIAKPFSVSDLLAEVRQAFSKNSVEQARHDGCATRSR